MAGVTWTEKTVAGSGYTPGYPVVGGLVRVLFGAIVFNQGRVVDAPSTYTEQTVPEATYTERIVPLRVP